MEDLINILKEMRSDEDIKGDLENVQGPLSMQSLQTELLLDMRRLLVYLASVPPEEVWGEDLLNLAGEESL